MSAPHSIDRDRSTDRPAPLHAEEQRQLVELAHGTIVARLERRSLPTLPSGPRFEQPAGAFVTVTVRGDLRGCIGIPEAARALAEVVQHCAQAAAFEDPRFPSIGLHEIQMLGIEISVLSPLRRVDDPASIEIGRDGLVIERGWHRGLLLPQVATEHGFDREQFLAQTCVKAGLPPNAWREGATIYSFDAQVFHGQ